jgi:hypothetical protein
LQLIKRYPFHHFEGRKPFGSNSLHGGNVSNNCLRRTPPDSPCIKNVQIVIGYLYN